MTTLRVRQPAVAGSFYPSDPAALRTSVQSYLDDAVARVPPGPTPKAIVAPHAGYMCSGPVAASAYARLLPLRGRVERVVLAGPAHWVALDRVAASSADAFATPLGPVTVDTGARAELLAAGLVVISDEAHAREHSLEVQLPFLQVVLGEITVLPLVVGAVPAQRVADMLEAVWGGPETLILVSTDLSHYHDHSTATRQDRRTAAAVQEKRPEALAPDDACGVFPLRGLLEAARRTAAEVELLDLRTSADTTGEARRVVGYGAFALS